MVSSSEDPDSGPGTGDEAGGDGRGRVDGSGQPTQPQQQRSQSNRGQGERVTTERKVKITEKRRETITSKGFHDLSSSINSLDDHFQAGLQEVRNNLANIHQERTTLTEHLRSVSEKLAEVSGEKNECQQVITDLQQSHMESIASQLRDRHLAHRTIVKWRRKVLERGHYSVVRLLEDENSQLRAELLKCQEAAKQAFLRSANALNSEAITMFQDAATRRLGYEGSLEGRSSPLPLPSSSSSSAPSSPGSPEPSRGHSGSEGGRRGEPEASAGGYFGREGLRGGAGGGAAAGSGAEAADWGRRGSGSRSRSREEGPRHGQTREARGGYEDASALHGPRGLPVQPRTFPDSPFGSRESLDSGDSDAYPTQAQRAGHARTFPFGGSRDGGGASDDARGHAEEQGAVPKRHPPAPTGASDYAPDSLREEARARLSQLQDERRHRMPDAHLPSHSAASRPEQQGRAPRTLASRPASATHRPCRCRTPPAGPPRDPYRCPYCTPIQNSSFGHAKDALRKPERREGREGPRAVLGGGSNLTRSAILAGGKADQKKVIYKPSASTVVIEKHLKN
ncbi:keratin, type I cytoskeletal 9-like isoform X2 [Penaeus japonicus]|uniref:keratin, type I cytoskeletal 9-like isoform X2 n=1 Tax=Penaeus japonicus TaxID=27405 RepID=UPI001C70DC8D|nr:keratin, type I cytoskeletal 9-like isoform X2 [Penaeus japonicus]